MKINLAMWRKALNVIPNVSKEEWAQLDDDSSIFIHRILGCHQILHTDHGDRLVCFADVYQSLPVSAKTQAR